MIAKTQELLNHLKQNFSPLANVRDLGIAEQQMVEIAKALMNNCKVLILDEPTAAVTDKETRILFETIRALKRRGVAILYISHRLEELFDIGDCTTVLRNGRSVYSGETKSQTVPGLIRHMIGRALGDEFPELPSPRDEYVMRIDNVSIPGTLTNVTFSLRKGEILGFYGLIGAGRTELMRALYGLDHVTQGSIEIFGEKRFLASPRDAIGCGVGMVPEDRKRQGLLLGRPVKENISIALLDKLCRFGFLRKQAEADLADRNIKNFSIKVSHRDELAVHLSGGNQQKVVISKVLSTLPEIIIFDEPTRGIDVGAKQEVYRAITALLSEGKSILMVSSDIREVIGMSHRIVVMCEGAVAAEIPRESASQELILFHSFPKVAALPQ